jgi:hypothetical protein
MNFQGEIRFFSSREKYITIIITEFKYRLKIRPVTSWKKYVIENFSSTFLHSLKFFHPGPIFLHFTTYSWFICSHYIILMFAKNIFFYFQNFIFHEMKIFLVIKERALRSPKKCFGFWKVKVYFSPIFMRRKQKVVGSNPCFNNSFEIEV